MKLINVDVVPVLPLNGIFSGECVAMGMFENGVVVSYIERDIAVLIEWDEIIKNGIAFIDGDTESDEPSSDNQVREFVPSDTP